MAGISCGFVGRSIPLRAFRSFDVTADGARLLAVTIPDASRPRQIEIVTDWAKELERLAPGGSR
jgi:hypothetical protein